MDVKETISLILKLMELDQAETTRCKDCETCKMSKGIKDKIIVLSAETIAVQSEMINDRKNSLSTPSSSPKRPPPSGHDIN